VASWSGRTDESCVLDRAAAVVLEEQILRHGGLLCLGRACRGPSHGERSRSELLDLESLI
jgi:hypothetical protein